MDRKDTKKVKIGNLTIGGSNKIVIQSMCNIKTSNIKPVLAQINQLSNLGCELIRVSVLDDADVKALKNITLKSPIPVCADIHFDYKYALLAIQNGVNKIRINPANLGGVNHFITIIKEAKKHNVAIRIGFNEGSIKNNKNNLKQNEIIKYMLSDAKKYISIAEKNDFYNLVLSFKSSNVNTTIKVNEKAAKLFNYPLHLGLTEAGNLETSLVRSSTALGILLNEGIGNTIRISITGDPKNEIIACKELLKCLNLRNNCATLVSCPTCGRTMFDLEKVVNEVKPYIDKINKDIKVAIMGCVVNGPGEAKDADIGIAGSKEKVVLFKKDKIIGTYNSKNISEVLIKELKKYCKK